MSDSLENRKDLAPAFSRPNDDPITKPNDLVRRAVLQLGAFGDLNQGAVRRILPYWRHFEALSPDDMLAVESAFPPGEDPDRTVKRASTDDEAADTGTHWVDLGTGPGYVPGEGRS